MGLCFKLRNYVTTACNHSFIIFSIILCFSLGTEEDFFTFRYIS